LREWKIAALRLPCGHSFGCWVQPGEQYCVLKGDGWITAKVRCASHAGSEPPAEVLAGSESQGERECEPLMPLPDPAGFSSVKHLAQAAETDWARKAANDTDED
jgi:hypothetical protein